MNSRLIWSFLLLSTVFALTSTSTAGCWGYYQLGPFPCSSNGCTGEYYTTVCGPECTSGSCTNQGGSGECCGQFYYSATIFPDGDPFISRTDCEVLIGRKRENPDPVQQLVASSGLRKATTVGRLERRNQLLFIPDTCRGTYGVVVDNRSISMGRW
jgi:hypothetical protein